MFAWNLSVYCNFSYDVMISYALDYGESAGKNVKLHLQQYVVLPLKILNNANMIQKKSLEFSASEVPRIKSPSFKVHRIQSH